MIPSRRGIRRRMKGIFAKSVEFFIKGRLLVLLVLAYIALGAVLFHHLEKQEEINAAALVTEHHYNVLRAFNETKRIIVARFANKTPAGQTFKTALASMRRIMKRHYINAIKQARAATLKRTNDSFPLYQLPYIGQEGVDMDKWSLVSAAVFCATTLSTIGYGHVVPTTLIGRSVFMVYSIVAIPVMSIYLIDVSLNLSRGIEFVYGKVYMKLFCHCRVRRKKNRIEVVEQKVKKGSNVPKLSDQVKNAGKLFTVSQNFQSQVHKVDGAFDKNSNIERDLETMKSDAQAVGVQVNVPFYFFIFVYALYMAAGMYVFHKSEKWSWVESVYFVFVTLSTIGYGDFVPKLNNNLDDGDLAYDRIAVSLFLILYVTAGLAIAAMAVKMMTKDLSRRMRKIFPIRRGKAA